MSERASNSNFDYAQLLAQVKERIRGGQVRAVLSANAELIRLYWDIGRMLVDRQAQEGYGTRVIPRLSRDLRNDLSEEKGFSERNIDRMVAFFRAYPDPFALSPQAVAKLPPTPLAPKAGSSTVSPQAVAKLATNAKNAARSPQEAASDASLLWFIPWGHHALLLAKVPDVNDRLWYMSQTLKNGWSRNVLLHMIATNAHVRQSKAVTNFPDQLPPVQSDLVVQTLKDPYIFDFLTLEAPFHERELETQLLQHLERFLIELGQGFAFVGRQHHIAVGDQDFYIDLLFYHLTLRCFVVIDLKTGEFKPEDAGKMNFYLSVVDDKLRHATDAPSIGLILCQQRNRVIAEYALRGAKKPIGISEYELTRALPTELESKLPTIEAIEAELANNPSEPLPKPKRPAKQATGRATAPAKTKNRREP